MSTGAPAVGIRSRGRRSRARAGDPEAFAALYATHEQELLRYCRSILRSEEDARDALQNAMVKAFTALQTERRDLALRPWLFRIAHNEAISLIRRRPQTTELDETLGGAEDTVQQTVETRERLAHLRADLQDLPERQRGALVMRELSGLSHEEIGAALGTSARAAKQTLYEARTSLADCAEGRAMECESVQRALSDGDGRVSRTRRMRAHLRDCRTCERFRLGLLERPAELAALSPAVPLLGASGILALLNGGTVAGGLAGSVAGAGSAVGAGASAAGAGASVAGAGGSVAGAGAVTGMAAAAATAGGGFGATLLTAGGAKLAAVAATAVLAGGTAVVAGPSVVRGGSSDGAAATTTTGGPGSTGPGAARPTGATGVTGSGRGRGPGSPPGAATSGAAATPSSAGAKDIRNEAKDGGSSAGSGRGKDAASPGSASEDAKAGDGRAAKADRGNGSSAASTGPGAQAARDAAAAKEARDERKAQAAREAAAAKAARDAAKAKAARGAAAAKAAKDAAREKAAREAAAAKAAREKAAREKAARAKAAADAREAAAAGSSNGSSDGPNGNAGSNGKKP